MSSNSNHANEAPPACASHAVFARCNALAVAMVCLYVLFVPSARADQEACVAAHEQGQELRIQGRLQAARDSFAQCAQNCPKLISQDCKSLLAEVEQSVPSVVFAISNEEGADLAGARVFVDDKPFGESDGRAQPLDPGSYRIRVEAEGYATLERKLTIYAGEKQRVLRLQLARANVAESSASSAPPTTSESGAPGEPSSGVPLATYVLGGAAIAVAGTAIALGVLGKGDLDDLKRCTEDCGEFKSRGRKLYIAADVGFGVAGGLAVAATWVYVAKLLGEKPSTSQAARVTPWFDAKSTGLALHTSF